MSASYKLKLRYKRKCTIYYADYGQILEQKSQAADFIRNSLKRLLRSDHYKNSLDFK